MGMTHSFLVARSNSVISPQADPSASRSEFATKRGDNARVTLLILARAARAEQAKVLAAPGGKADSGYGLGGVEDASEIDSFDQVIRSSHPTVLLLGGVR